MTAIPPVAALPATYWEALKRGVLCQCPRCGGGRLFRKWLKVADRCPSCMVDFSPQQADDFPAYIAMIVTGHLLAPLIIMLSVDFALGPLAMFAILVPLALVMMLGMLQPAKGGVVATQWWFGMHGFVQERLPVPEEQPAS